MLNTECLIHAYMDRVSKCTERIHRVSLCVCCVAQDDIAAAPSTQAGATLLIQELQVRASHGNARALPHLASIEET